MAKTSTPTTVDQLWHTALAQLQLQMTQATFDAWLRDTHLISLTDDNLIVAAKNDFAVAWLQGRLLRVIERTVANLLGRQVEIEFVANGNGRPPAPERAPETAANGSNGNGASGIAPGPQLVPHSSDELWQVILNRLAELIPAAAFHTWLAETYLVSRHGANLVVGTRKDGAGVATLRDWQEWMTTGAHPVICQVAADVLGYAVDVAYVTPDLEQAGSTFAPHLKLLNAKTGYAPLPHYYIKYWESYLARRWKTAGSRAFVLRQKLIALDKRKVTSDEFTNWSPSFELTYEGLGALISVNYTVITGRRGHCQKYEEERKLGQPRGQDCCGRHEPAGCRIEKSGRSGQRHCYFWRPGVLEVLDAERMIAIDASGQTKNRHNRVCLQVWHSLPVLTPYQTAWLPDRLQAEHHSWLIENAGKMGWHVAEWQTISDETLVARSADYEVGRLYFGRFQPNPYQPAEAA